MCRKATGVSHWVGTVGLGVCATGTEYLDEPAIAAMVGDFEPDSFKVFSGIASEDDVKRLELKCGGSQAAFAIVHADPQNAQIAELIPRLADKVESGFLAGRAHELAPAEPPDRRPRDRRRALRRRVRRLGDDRDAPHARLQPDRPEAHGDELPAQHHRHARRPARARRLPRRRRRDDGRRRRAHRRPRLRRHRDSRQRHRRLHRAQSRRHRSREQARRDRRDRAARRERHVLPPGRGDRARRHDAHARQHQAGPVRAAARRGLLLVPRARRGPFRPELRGAQDDPLGARRFPARRLLLQRRDLAQPALRLHRRADAFLYESSLAGAQRDVARHPRARRCSPAAGSAMRFSPSATGARCRACTTPWTSSAASGWCA